MEMGAPNKNIKLCKACGKEVAKSALTCPHCGAKNKKPVFKRKWFWALAVLVVIMIFPSIYGKPFFTLEDVTESSAVINDEHVTSTELLKAHDDNPISFSEKYDGSTVTVTSEIKEILPRGTFNGRAHSAVIKLYGDWWVEVNDSTAAALNPGKEITITGTFENVWNSYLWVSGAILVN